MSEQAENAKLRAKLEKYKAAAQKEIKDVSSK